MISGYLWRKEILFKGRKVDGDSVQLVWGPKFANYTFDSNVNRDLILFQTELWFMSGLFKKHISSS